MNTTSYPGISALAAASVETVPLSVAAPIIDAAPVAAAPSVTPLGASSFAPVSNATTTIATNATDGSLLSNLPGGAGGAWSSYFQAIAWLCFIIAMLWLLVWLFKKARAGFLAGSAPSMSIESRLALGPKKWVVVARFLDRRLVLGVTDHQITLLTELGIDDDSKSDNDDFTKAFGSALKSAGAKHEARPEKLTLDLREKEPQGQPPSPAPSADDGEDILVLSKD